MLDLTGTFGDNSSSKLQVCCFFSDANLARKVVTQIKATYTAVEVSSLKELKVKPPLV